MVSEVFSDLDNSDFLIIGFIGKHGVNNKNRIGSKSQASLTNRQVNERIKKLIDNDYLRIVKTIPWKIPGKNTELIGLTYKGFFASLNQVSFKNNMLIQRNFSINFIPEIYSNSLELILDEIIEFLLYHKLLKIDLSKLNSKTLALYFYKIYLDYDIVQFDKPSTSILNSIQHDKNNQISKIETFLRNYCIDEIKNLEHGIKSEKSERVAILINFHPFVISWLCNGGKNIHNELNNWRKSDKKYPFDIEKAYRHRVELIDNRTFGF